jgi:hypothetical protein
MRRPHIGARCPPKMQVDPGFRLFGSSKTAAAQGETISVALGSHPYKHGASDLPALNFADHVPNELV